MTASNSGGANPATSNVVGPVLPAAPVVSTAAGDQWDGAAGEHAEREQRRVEQQSEQQRSERLHVRVGGLQQLGEHVLGDQWRDVEQLHAAGVGCRRVRRRDRDRFELGRADARDECDRRSGPPPGSCGQHRAGNQRDRAAGEHADREPRTVEQQPDRVQLRVAGLRQHGQQLRDDCRRATSSTYKVTAADVGSYVSVTVTAMNSGGTASVTSASVGPRAAAGAGEHQSAGDHRDT